jgi:putative intracellular protease/amidase
MPASIDVLHPDRPKRVLIVASNLAVSTVTGWPVGFWWSELTHPWWEFTEHGYEVEIASPEGGALRGDSLSDPRDDSGYSAHDLISLGFIESPRHAALVQDSTPLDGVNIDAFDAVLFIGGQGPMFTFVDNKVVHRVLTGFYDAGKITGVICHATAVLLTARSSDGRLMVEGRTWTGFANSEEQFADDFVGHRIQPFWIEDEARSVEDTNFIVAGRFKAHAIRDGNLVTGQQQYSGAAAARLMISALGI